MNISIPARQPKSSWPEYHLESRRPIICSLHVLDMPELRALKCKGWRVQKNAEFNFLRLSLQPNTQRTLDRWVEQLGVLGQPHNVLFRTKRFDVEMYRPVLTYHTEFEVDFHCLHGPVSVVQY